MKTFALTLFALLLAGLPATASILYSNGPVNGTSTAYYIDVYVVSDQFTPSGSDMTGFEIAEWVDSGVTPLTFDWAVGSAAFGNDVASGVATIGGAGNATATLLCQSGAAFNGGTCGASFGYDVYQVDVSTGPITVSAGDWLTLTGATDNEDLRDAWDMNSGPSQAEHNTLGSVPSESFSITSGAVPEPSTLMLFGCGFLGLAAVLRRKANR
jgi:hypothetical protein